MIQACINKLRLYITLIRADKQLKRKLHYFDLLLLSNNLWSHNKRGDVPARCAGPTRRRACCVDHKSDDMSRCCGFVVQLVVQQKTK